MVKTLWGTPANSISPVLSGGGELWSQQAGRNNELISDALEGISFLRNEVYRQKMCLFPPASRLAEGGLGPAARPPSKGASSRVQLREDAGIYGPPGRAKQPGLEVSNWARRAAQVFSEALQAVGPLGKMRLKHWGVIWSPLSSRVKAWAGAFPG